MATVRATLGTLFVAVTLCIGSSSSAKILVYPFGHCLTSHLLNAEKVLAAAAAAAASRRSMRSITCGLL